MGKSGKIPQYRERLDKTLATSELTNNDALKNLIRKQILHSSLNEYEGCGENVIEKRATEVSHFLDTLRSASISENKMSKTSEASPGEWKLKDDNEDHRVMYREGPQGTPFYTLLVEGYVDGPVDSCLCLSWESNLYKKWWPQYRFPPFKITICKCLQKIRIGEQISLVRVKVTWPLSAREAVVHYFLFEYLEDGLIIVLLNTISDLEGIDRSTHGFTKDGIPESEDVVRIDVVGGFAIQKMTSERSYFRTIVNIDLKLDFVSTSLTNFISRQLIGSGFRLYQKVVTSVLKNDEDYSNALEDPLYARIREALYSIDEADGTIKRKDLADEAYLLVQQQHSIEAMQKTTGDVEWIVHGYGEAGKSFPENQQVLPESVIGEVMKEKIEESVHLKDKMGCIKREVQGKNIEINAMTTQRNSFCEIEEVEKENINSENRHNDMDQPATDERAAQDRFVNCQGNIVISPGVKKAIKTLVKAISIVREHGYSTSSPLPILTKENTPYQENIAEKDPQSSDVCSNEVSSEAYVQGKIVESASHEHRNSTSNRDIMRSGSNASTRKCITTG